MEDKSLIEKIEGCLFGLAIGDALGYQVEFMDLKDISKKFGKGGVRDLDSSGFYSDDTQMSLATARALIDSKSQNTEEIMSNIRKRYIEWLNSPDNNRAPGFTSLNGVKNLKKGIPWKKSGITDSKSCGAAMRTAPIGIYFHNNPSKLIDVAYAASVCTHATPIAYTSGIATASLTALAMNNEHRRSMLSNLEKLGDRFASEFREKIHSIRGVLRYSNPLDAINELGEGWNGDEAVAIALYCFLKNPKDYQKTVLMAANTPGDSDSIACIAGAISGAYNGIRKIPQKWIRNIENKELIKRISQEMYLAIKPQGL